MERKWWQAPIDTDEEYHTPRVWEQITQAAETAGDTARAEEARDACERESRNCI